MNHTIKWRDFENLLMPWDGEDSDDRYFYWCHKSNEWFLRTGIDDVEDIIPIQKALDDPFWRGLIAPRAFLYWMRKARTEGLVFDARRVAKYDEAAQAWAEIAEMETRE